MLDSIEVVIYTSYFLLPGYLISEIAKHFIPTRNINDFEKTIRSLGYSILELALWYWLFAMIEQKYIDTPYKYWLILIIAVVGSSVLTGIIVGVIQQGKWLRKVMEFFDVQTDHPIPNGWDYKFSEIKTKRWVCVSLDNGTFIRGVFGSNSLASSVEGNHDLYLEEVYYMDEDMNWIKEERTDGIWISAESIKWINFYKDKNGVEDDGE